MRPARLWIGAASCLSMLALTLGGCRSDGSAGPGVDAAGGSGGGLRMDGSAGQAGDAMSVDTSPDAGVDQGGGGIEAGTDSGPQVLGACLGVCLETLIAQCPRNDMTCVSSTATMDITHYTTTSCFANGVKRQQVQSDSMTMTTVRKANGDVCYRVTSDSAASTADYVDAAGSPVGRIQYGNPSTLVTVTCSNGSVTRGNLASPGCAGFPRRRLARTERAHGESIENVHIGAPRPSQAAVIAVVSCSGDGGGVRAEQRVVAPGDGRVLHPTAGGHAVRLDQRQTGWVRARRDVQRQIVGGHRPGQAELRRIDSVHGPGITRR